MRKREYGRYDKFGKRDRKRPNFNEIPEEVVSEVDGNLGPNLQWLEYGQVLYADVPWGPDMRDCKRRPVMFIEPETKSDAVIRAFYSKPREGADFVTYRGRKSYLGSPVVIERSNIYAVSTARVESEINPLKAETTSWEE